MTLPRPRRPVVAWLALAACAAAGAAVAAASRPPALGRPGPIVAASGSVAVASGPFVVGSGVGRTRQAVPQQPSSAGQQPLPSFKAGIDIVSLTVTVTDPAGRYVTGLDTGDFGVYEDGVKQDVEFFNRSNLPIALSLLLDTSASMDEKMRTAQEAAAGFARRLRPQDLGELVDFDSRVTVTQGFTSDTAALETAIRKTTAGGSTSLYNAVYIALRELKKAKAQTEADVRRQAIVVLSDGEDTSSLVSYDQVLDLAKRSETSIYTIGLRSKEEAQTKGYKEAEFVLRDLAQETGGRVFFPEKVEELEGIYSQISEELASQYMLAYTSKNTKRDGAWRRVVVRVDRPGVTARTKQGYFGPAR